MPASPVCLLVPSLANLTPRYYSASVSLCLFAFHSHHVVLAIQQPSRYRWHLSGVVHLLYRAMLPCTIHGTALVCGRHSVSSRCHSVACPVVTLNDVSSSKPRETLSSVVEFICVQNGGVPATPLVLSPDLGHTFWEPFEHKHDSQKDRSVVVTQNCAQCLIL